MEGNRKNKGLASDSLKPFDQILKKVKKKKTPQKLDLENTKTKKSEKKKSKSIALRARSNYFTKQFNLDISQKEVTENFIRLGFRES